MKALLGRVARAARRAGLGGAFAWTRDRLDALLLRLDAPVLSASVGGRKLHGFLRHRSFLADVEGGDYEPSLSRVIRESVGPGVLFVDIGSHVGYYSVLAAAAGADVVAVEPDPYTNAALRKNVRGLPVEVHSAAVADAVGKRTFHPSESTTGSSLLARDDIPMLPGVDVSTTTVDALVAGRYDRPVVVKIDVEGAEPLALAGAAETLRRAERLVCIAEVNPAALAGAGYGAADVVGPLAEAGLAVEFIDQSGNVGPLPEAPTKGNLVARR